MSNQGSNQFKLFLHSLKCATTFINIFNYVISQIFQLQFEPESDLGYSALGYAHEAPFGHHAMKMKRKSVQALRRLAQQILAARQVMNQERKMMPRLF